MINQTDNNFLDISKLLSGELENEVRIYFSERHILFEFDNTIVLSRLIEGEFTFHFTV